MNRRAIVWWTGLTSLIIWSALSFAREAPQPLYPFSEIQGDIVDPGQYQPKVWGLIDAQGHVVVPARFDEIGETNASMEHHPVTAEPFPAQVGDKWGFIDSSGRVVIEAKYDAARAFRDGIAHVQAGEGEGYIDATGAIVIPLDLKSCGDFSEGLVEAVPKDKKAFGYMDRSGKWVIPPRFDFADRFSEGRAGVYHGDLQDLLDWRGDNWSFIDSTGRTAFRGKFERAYPYSEGLACVRVHGKFGYIDRSGNVVIPPRFVRARSFSEGLAAVCTSADINRSDEWGFIDRTGRMVIAPQKWDVGDFAEGVASVHPMETVEAESPEVKDFPGFPEGGQWLTFKELGAPGFIDRTGHVLFTFEGASYAGPFESGLASIQYGRGGPWAFVDHSGRIVWTGAKKPEAAR